MTQTRTIRRPIGRIAGGVLAGVLALAVGPGPAMADTEPPGAKRVVTLKEMRQRNVVIQKWDLSCGAAALATLLQHQHGLPITERDIARAMLGGTDRKLVQARMGFSLLDMKRLVEAVGLEGVGYGSLTLTDLEKLTPAIVPIRITETFAHFVVFRGIVGDRVVLADPAFGNRTMPVARFDDIWERKVAFVINRRDGVRPPDRIAAGPSDYLVPAGGALRTAMR